CAGCLSLQISTMQIDSTTRFGGSGSGSRTCVLVRKNAPVRQAILSVRQSGPRQGITRVLFGCLLKVFPALPQIRFSATLPQIAAFHVGLVSRGIDHTRRGQQRPLPRSHFDQALRAEISLARSAEVA